MSDHDIDRVKTGIPGLDELIEGGFPRADTILIAGKAGTGKSILATQFIYKGATEYDEPGVFVTLEEPPHLIKRNMLRFGMDLDAVIKEGKMSLVDLSPSKEVTPVTIGEYPSFDLSGLQAIIMNHIKKIDAKRVVLDTISIMAYKFRSRDILREEFFKLAAAITRTGCSLKLRGSKHSSRIHSMRITDEGIRVHSMRITDEGIRVWPGEISPGH